MRTDEAGHDGPVDKSDIQGALAGTTEALDRFGLQFQEPGSSDAERPWSLEVRPDTTPAQQARLRCLVTSSRR